MFSNKPYTIFFLILFFYIYIYNDDIYINMLHRLIDYGYPNVYVVSGGDKGWEDAGCPLVK